MADGPVIGYAALQIIPSFRGAEAAITQGLSATGAAETAGADAGRSFSGGFSSILKGGVFAGGTVLAVGGALAAIGEKFDSAFDEIRVRTGATGDVLAGLGDDFRQVLRDVPTDTDKAAAAIGDLNARLGLTGDELQQRADQFLELARVTGTDLAGNIESVSHLFTQWNVPAAQMGDRLDELFRASQATGIGVSDLASQLTDSGVVLRQVGLDFDQSTALLGALGKAGLDVGSVVPALSRALATAAREGKPAQQVFADTFAAIKDAPNDTAAAGAALDVFGARAGPRLAALIREGQLSYEDLVGQIAGGTDTILGAAADTNDWRESLELLKNRALLAIEPIAARVFTGLSTALDRLVPLFDELSTGLGDLVAGFEGGKTPASGFLGTMGQIGDALREAFDTAKPFIDWLRQNWKPVLAGAAVALGLIFAPITTIVGGLAIAYIKFKGFRDGVNAVAQFLIRNVPPTFEAIRGAIEAAVRWISDNVVPVISEVVGFIADQFAHLADWTRDHWDAISETIGHVINVIRDVVNAGVELVKGIWSRFGANILDLVHQVWDEIVTIVRTAVRLVRDVIQVVIDVINGDWGKAWDDIKDVISTVWDFITSTVGNAIGAVRDVIGSVLSAIKGIWTGAWGFMRGVVDRVWDGIVSAFDGVINGIISVLERGINFVIGIINLLIDAYNVLPFHDDVSEIGAVHIARLGTSTPTGSQSIIPIAGSFGDGGVIPGPLGAPRLALVHGGETVLATHRPEFRDATTGRGPVHVHVDGDPTNRQVARLRRIAEYVTGETFDDIARKAS